MLYNSFTLFFLCFLFLLCSFSFFSIFQTSKGNGMLPNDPPLDPPVTYAKSIKLTSNISTKK